MDNLYDAILGSVTLKQCREADVSPEVQFIANRMSGAIDPSAISVTSAAPKATFTCDDLAGILAGISVSAGLAIASGTITIPFHKRADGSTFGGNSAHAILSATDAVAVIRAISGSQGDENASAEIEVQFKSTDGLTAPVTASVNNTLSSQSYGNAFAMGPLYIDGSALSQVTSVRVEPGVKIVAKRFDGSVYPTLIYIESRDPMITVTFENLDAMYSQAALFASMTSAAAYFRKRVDGGTFVSDVSTVHIKQSLGTGLKVMQGIRGSGQSNAQATLKLVGKALTSSYASAIGA
jgi:hypothetical protein